MRKVYSGLLAPVHVEELEKLSGDHVVVAGTGIYNAIVDFERGSSLQWAVAIAEQLTKRSAGELHAFDSDGDEIEWVITIRDGVRTHDDVGRPTPHRLGVPLEIA
jgi:hypothetical protein